MTLVERVVDASIRNKALVFAITALAALWSLASLSRMPLDAIPDLTDTQVIVYSRWDRSPDLVEDQVTYPIVSAMLGAPGVRAVRGFSDFGYSFVYVLFDDDVDVYWARSRTLEYLSAVLPTLPEGVQTQLGPDATALGWVYQYVLVDTTGSRGLDELRSLQDWYLRYHLKAVPGVAEVAPLGGFRRQYQVQVDPNRLRAYGIPIADVVDAVRGANVEVGGRLVEFGGAEYMVRGRGYARSIQDFEEVVVAAGDTGSPIRVRDLGVVVEGPELRRGVADLDGTGDTVSGIVIVRQGRNALEVIGRVKEKLREIEAGLPEGVRVVPVYDRSELIRRAISTLTTAILEVVLTISIVILLFLWHLPSSIIPIVTIPLAVLLAFLPFGWMGLTANIMSLGGIAIAIGALDDAAIVVVEQTHKKLEEWQRAGSVGDYREVVRRAIGQVAGPSFFSLLVIGVSFLPVLALEAQEGRLFKPLAYTKILAMTIAAVLAITLDPALRMLFTRRERYAFRPAWLASAANAAFVGTIRQEERHPVSRFLMRAYAPAARWSLDHKGAVFAVAIVLLLATVPLFLGLGSEFMPPLEEGALFYMPTTMPGISATEAQRLLQVTDRVMMGFPEVARVLGKAGRAETATDPAPLSMFETVLVLKPEEEWRRVDTWYSSWAPELVKPLLRRITSDRIPQERLVEELNDALRLPGLSNAWTMPIKARIDMLSTGIRTPVGLKISGADLAAIESIGVEAERVLRDVPGTRSVFAERTGGGYFLDIDWKRDALARYGLTVEEAQEVVQAAIGGESITTTVEGRARYAVSVRYLPDFRSDPDAVGRVLVPAGSGDRQVALAQLAEVSVSTGPSMIRNEDGLLTGYVYVDLAGRDPAAYVEEADALLRAKVKVPPGYAIGWSGQYESMVRVRERLLVVVPITLLLILILLLMNTRSPTKTAIVMLAVPFSAVGAIACVWALGYAMSPAVWVGLIALLGVDAETGVFMLLYLDLAWEQARSEGRMNTRDDLRRAVLEGAVQRLRPKFMTVTTTFVGLLPILWATGAGSAIMKRIAAPMVGGILTSFLLELLVYPAVYEVWRGRSLRSS
ncbi:MAG TPA: CusA/CzcA family heavy metal efflux RND transporter [Candidatus Polarisedimenticolaceae bacterium]